LLTTNSLQVVVTQASGPPIVQVQPGYIVKDDVLINIKNPHNVDFSIEENWATTPPDPFLFAGGNVYVVLEYTYQKQRPAPVAKILLLRPDERNLVSGYLLLKVIELSATPSSVLETYDSDPEVGFQTNTRKYLKYYAGGAVDLGAHTPDDIGRIVFEGRRNKFFFGHEADWQELTSGGVAVDIETPPGVFPGQLCYINNNSEATPAISSDTTSTIAFETGADLCILALSDPMTGPGRGIITGFAQGVPVESGIELSPGDILYLSAVQAGTITNVRPANFFQVIGRALDAANEFNPANIIFSPKMMITLGMSGTISSWVGPDGDGRYYHEIGIQAIDTTAITVVDAHWFDASTDKEIVPADVELLFDGQILRVYMTDNTSVLNYMIQTPATALVAGGGGGGGGGGTSNHAQLLNLDFVGSQHTGFTPNPHDNAYHSETYATVDQLVSIDATSLNGFDVDYFTNASNLATGTISGDRGVLASDNIVSFLRYTGWTKTPGALYGGTIDPNDSVRLNYDGYFYATSVLALTFYGNGSALTNLNASNLSSGTISGDRGVASGSTLQSFLRYTGTTKTIGCLYGGPTSTAPNNTTMLSYDGQLRATNFIASGAVTSVAVSSFNGVQISSGAGTGTSNVGVGANFLVSNTTGHTNVGIGVNCLYSNTTGNSNIAIGKSSLGLNTSGQRNVSVGEEALSKNLTGHYNTAVGSYALRNQTGTIWNTAIGYQSSNSVNGTGNTSVGANSLLGITTGTYNTAIGYIAMGSGISGSGSGNTAIGVEAGHNINSGDFNTCVGREAGRYITSGTNNIIIGYGAGSFAAYPGGSVTTQSNQIIMGNNSHTNAYIRVGWFVTSDERDKTNFGTVPHGLDFVNKLNPILFQNRISRDTDEGHGPFYYGFKAQEVLKLEGENPVIIDTSNPEKLSLHDSSMIPVLVNAIKELSAEVDRLKTKLAEK
jgi:hypothetical protein